MLFKKQICENATAAKLVNDLVFKCFLQGSQRRGFLH